MIKMLSFILIALSLKQKIDLFYDKAPADVKLQIVDSIFDGKLIFDGKKYRTAKLNEAVSAITMYDRDFRRPEKRKVGKNADQSSEAPPELTDTNTLKDDLKLLSELIE